MKKILISLMIIILSLTNTFAYISTSKDEEKLTNIYKQVDVLSKKNPEQIKILYEKVLKIIPTLTKDDRNKYLITNLWDYLSTKLNNKTEENTSSWVLEYDVIEIIDWDTIKINYEWKEKNIRMIWIDAPESSTTRYWYIEDYWTWAKEKLKELIWNNKINIELDDSQWKYDKYNRLLAYVFVSWINVNQKMIELWYAKEYTYNKAYKYQKEFKEAQKNAEDNKVWIWKKTNKENDTNTWSTKKVDSEKIYITWPKWWCYYINSNWNKSYVDKSYCWSVETNTTTNSTNNSNSSSSSGHNYYTWPKWWCYYYNSKWKKTYVSRSLCN